MTCLLSTFWWCSRCLLSTCLARALGLVGSTCNNFGPCPFALVDYGWDRVDGACYDFAQLVALRDTHSIYFGNSARSPPYLTPLTHPFLPFCRTFPQSLRPLSRTPHPIPPSLRLLLLAFHLLRAILRALSFLYYTIASISSLSQLLALVRPLLRPLLRPILRLSYASLTHLYPHSLAPTILRPISSISRMHSHASQAPILCTHSYKYIYYALC